MNNTEFDLIFYYFKLDIFRKLLVILNYLLIISQFISNLYLIINQFFITFNFKLKKYRFIVVEYTVTTKIINLKYRNYLKKNDSER